MSRLAATVALALPLTGLFFVQQQYRYVRAEAAGDHLAATRIWTANPEAWRNRALDDLGTSPAAALTDAQQAVNDDAGNWRNWAVMAQVQMGLGDTAAARASMREISTRATDYEAHWRAANLALIDGNTAEFAEQAADALAFALPGAMQETLSQAWAMNPSAPATDAILARAQQKALDPRQPFQLSLAALQFYATQHDPDAARWWNALLALKLDAQQQTQLHQVAEDYLRARLDAGAGADAAAIWSAAAAHNLFAPTDGPTPANAIANPDFAAPLDDAPLQWKVCTDCGPWVSRSQAPAAPALQLEFHGDQHDTAVLARQVLLPLPAGRYRLSFRTTGATPAGLQATLLNLSTGATLMTVSAAQGEATADLTLAAPLPQPELRMLYQRPLGQSPLNGRVAVNGFALTPIH